MEALGDFRLSDFQEQFVENTAGTILLTLNSKLSIEQISLIKKYSNWKKI